MMEGLNVITESAAVLVTCGLALNEIAKMDGDFSSIPKKLGMMALGIGGIIIVAGAVEYFMKKTEGSTMLEGLNVITESAAVLVTCGTALNEIAKMDGDFSSIPKKLGMMALGIGGIVIVAGAVEYYMKKTEGSTMIEGLNVIKESAAVLLTCGAALNEIAKMDGDFSSLPEKLGMIALGVGGMVLVAGAVGKFMSNAGAKVMAKGLATIAVSAALLYGCGIAMNEIAKLNGDFSSIPEKLKMMAAAIGGLGVVALAVGALMSTGLVAPMIAGVVTIIGLTAVLWILGKAFESFANMDFNAEKVKEKMDGFLQVFKSIAAFGEQVDWDFLVNSLKTGVIAFIDLGVMAMFVGLAAELKAIEEIDLDADAVNESISSIMNVLNKITEFGEGKDLTTIIEGIVTLVSTFIDKNIVGNLVSIAKQLNTLQGLELDENKISEATNAIKSGLNAIQSISEDGEGKDLTTIVDKIVTLVTTFIDRGIVANLVSIAKQLQELQAVELDENKIKETSKAIKSGLDAIKSINQDDDDSIWEKIQAVFSVLLDKGIVSKYLAVAKELEKLQELELDENKIKETTKAIKSGLNAIKSINQDDDDSKIWKKIQEVFTGLLDKGIVSKYLAVAKKIE